MRLKPSMIVGIPYFYKEVLLAWSDFLRFVSFVLENRGQMLEHPLFLNPLLTVEGEAVYDKCFLDAGIVKIKDVMYEVREGFLPLQAVVDMVQEADEDVSVVTIQKVFAKIKSAVPPSWVSVIDKGQAEREGEGVLFPGMFFQKGRET